MSTPNVDLRFGPVAGLLCGLIGGLYGMVARHGWDILWPVIGVAVVAGIACLTFLIRRQREIPYWAGVIATSLVATSVVATVWGLASRAGL